MSKHRRSTPTVADFPFASCTSSLSLSLQFAAGQPFPKDYFNRRSSIICKMYRSKRLRRLGMAALVCTLTFVFTGPENTGYGQQAHSFDATSRQTTTLEHEVHAN